MNLWILENDSGRTLLYHSFSELKSDEDLISGLITALNQFTMTEFDDPIESIDMGGLRWIYIQDNESNLLFVGCDTKDLNAETIRSRLDAIKQAFIDKYVINEKIYSSEWTGSLNEFEPFKKVLEDYYHQWTFAENIDSFAEIFDILGVNQQILNIIRRMLHYHILGEMQDMIYRAIEEVFEEFSKQKEILDNLELQKITFSRDKGFNILNLNPLNCDVNILKNQILKLLENIINVFKQKLGLDMSLHYFGKENLFKYILNNIILLKRLNLDVFLFNLLLLN